VADLVAIVYPDAYRAAAVMSMLKRFDEVQPEIAKFGGHILYTNLSAEAEARYEKLLARATPSAVTTDGGASTTRAAGQGAA